MPIDPANPFAVYVKPAQPDPAASAAPGGGAAPPTSLFDPVTTGLQGVADIGGHLGHIGMESWRAMGDANRQTAADLGAANLGDLGGLQGDASVVAAFAKLRQNPHDPAARSAAADALHGLGARIGAEGRLPMDVLQWLGSPFQGPIEEVGARSADVTNPAIRAATGGRMEADPMLQGNLIAMALPFIGEVNEARAVTAFARESGLPPETARMVLKRIKTEYAAGSAHATANRAARRLLGRGVGQAGLDVDAVRASADEHRAVGAGDPKLLDTMKLRGQRVVRGAGAKLGDAGDVLTEHREAVRADISGRASARARRLSQFRESVAQRVAKLEASRDSQAATTYREPYAQQFRTDDRLFDILDDKSLIGPVRMAEQTAKSRSLTSAEASQQYHELRNLQEYLTERADYDRKMAQWTKNLAGPQPRAPTLPKVSAGTIDRILVQARYRYRALSERAMTRGLAGGLNDRIGLLNGYLDDIPGLQEARASYKAYSQRIDQLEFDANLSTMDPRDFKEMVDGLTPESRQELVHNVAERLATKMAGSASGEMRQSDILDTGYNAQENLRILLGKEQADAYLKANKLIKGSLRAATFVDPALGSKTAGVVHDLQQISAEVGFDLLSGHHYGAMRRLGTWFARSLTGMNEAEARQIAEWAVSQDKVEDTLATIVNASRGKSGGRFLPGPLAGFKPVSMPPHIQALISAYASTNLGRPTQAGAQAQADGPEKANTTPFKLDPSNPFSPESLKKDSASPPAPNETGDDEAATLTGLKGDDLQAALDVMGVESGGAKGRLSPAAFNPAGGGEGAKGIAQWRGDRQAGMGSTKQDQLRHVGDELRNNPRFANVAAHMAAQPTMEGKYDVWLREYEGLTRGGPDYTRDMNNLMGRHNRVSESPSGGSGPMQNDDSDIDWSGVDDGQ